MVKFNVIVFCYIGFTLLNLKYILLLRYNDNVHVEHSFFYVIMNIGVQMIIEKGLTEAFNDDIPNKVMAMLVSAMYGDVVWQIKTEEQLSETMTLFEDMANSFVYYYYDYQDNIYQQEDLIYDESDIEEFIEENSVHSLVESTTDNKSINCASHSWTISARKEADKFKLTLSINDKDKLMQALTSYYTHYEVDDLINEYENMLLKEAHEKHLLSTLTADEYNLSYFHVNDIKYIKPICYGIIKETIFLHKAIIKLNEDSEVVDFKCTIDCTDFVENTKAEAPKITDAKPVNKKTTLTNRLTDIEKQVISARAYLQENSGKLRVSYRDIAEFLTNNGIYKINENNIKQKVSSIYAKLDIQDLGVAVALLKEANDLIAFDNVKIS